METGLAIINSINAVAFFQPGASTDVLDKLEVEVRAEAARLDISTDAGRKAIASLSHKVAKSKTGLDAAADALESVGLSKEDAVKVVTSIAQGKIPNVKISY